MSISHIYVKPSIAADSGAGTIGDPFGDTEYAIRQTTFDTINGTQVNVNDAAPEVLAAGLEVAMADVSVTPAWTPGRLAPCKIAGYTAVANDGGVAVFDCNLNKFIGNAALDYTSLIDLEIHDTGVNSSITLDNWCNIIRVRLHDTATGIVVGDDSQIIGCHIYDYGNWAIKTENEGMAAFNIVDSVTGNRTATAGIDLGNTGSMARRNIIRVDGATDGIIMPMSSRCVSNQIYSAAGSGSGIKASTANRDLLMVMNNIIAGFSGVGGVGFDFSAAGTRIDVYTGNSAYNNETDYAGDPLTIFTGYGTNEVLTAPPFTDPDNMNFAPVDTGAIKEGSTPNVFLPA